MVKIKGPLEAEGKAREFIEERHLGVKRVFFRTMRNERGYVASRERSQI